ncbi:MAG TPA: hypothetical protein VHO48_14565, partial [Anaerolineaceae bacterium]|nr:hypothetical protein [Anaerolineaceae bacterium]
MHRRLTICVLLVLFLFAQAQPVSAQSHLNVYYVGPQDGVYTTFGLSDDFDLVTTPDAADVIVLNG